MFNKHPCISYRSKDINFLLFCIMQRGLFFASEKCSRFPQFWSGNLEPINIIVPFNKLLQTVNWCQALSPIVWPWETLFCSKIWFDPFYREGLKNLDLGYLCSWKCQLHQIFREWFATPWEYSCKKWSIWNDCKRPKWCHQVYYVNGLKSRFFGRSSHNFGPIRFKFEYVIHHS